MNNEKETRLLKWLWEEAQAHQNTPKSQLFLEVHRMVISQRDELGVLENERIKLAKMVLECPEHIAAALAPKNYEIAGLKIRILEANRVMREIDRSIGLNHMDARHAISDARLDYSDPGTYPEGLPNSLK